MQHSGSELFKSVVQHLNPEKGATALGVIADIERIVLESSHVQLPVQENEPSIEYQFEGRHACVPPALIASETGKWTGRLYIGSLSAAISESWLRWAGVTHVVCVLGKYAGSNTVAVEWSVAHQQRYGGISYLDWAINAPAQRLNWREAFSLLSDALDSAANVVLVHCRNGKDRSCFAVYAFLRLVHEMDHTDALRHVYQRVDQKGYPLFDIACQSNELRQWVESNLGAALDAESGICCWQHCTG